MTGYEYCEVLFHGFSRVNPALPPHPPGRGDVEARTKSLQSKLLALAWYTTATPKYVALDYLNVGTSMSIPATAPEAIRELVRGSGRRQALDHGGHWGVALNTVAYLLYGGESLPRDPQVYRAFAIAFPSLAEAWGTALSLVRWVRISAFGQPDLSDQLETLAEQCRAALLLDMQFQLDEEPAPVDEVLVGE